MRRTAPRSRQESGKNLVDGRRDRSRRPQKQTAEAPGCLLPPLRSFPALAPQRSVVLRVGTAGAPTLPVRGQGEGGRRRPMPGSFLPVPPCPELSLFLLASVATRAVTDRQAARTQPPTSPWKSTFCSAKPKPATSEPKTSPTQPRSPARHRCGPEIEHRRAVSSGHRQ